MKYARIILGVLLAAGASLPLLSVWQSPPGAGRPIAERMSVPYPAVVAHRGASWHAPEETRPAYLLARELGVHYLEADVQRTRDGVLIALHDTDLKRTTNVEAVFPDRADASVAEFTFRELQRLDAGSWFNEAYPERARESFVDVKIISLQELIEIAEGGEHRPGLYLETKDALSFPGIEEELARFLRFRGWIVPDAREVEVAPDRVDVGAGPARVIFQSFEAESLAKLKEAAPEVPRVYLLGSDMVQDEGFEILTDRARELGHGAGPSGYLAWPWQTGPLHERGLLVHHYTINKLWQMQLLSFFGSDGFFTDRPELLMVYYGMLEDFNPQTDLEPVFQRIGY